MHTYTGYPMAKLARDMIKQGDLGEIRKIVVQYPQGWLATALENTGQMQATWRTDPKQSGAAGCMGDIGTHAANLAE
jgi:predicted dehydrogenase